MAHDKLLKDAAGAPVFNMTCRLRSKQLLGLKCLFEYEFETGPTIECS